MQYLLLGYDGTDSEAISRRMAARPAHLERSGKMKAEGKQLFGAAILDDEERMIGSVMVYECSSRAELDEWLKVEPYITGDVWKEIEIKPCRVAAANAQR